MSRRIIMYLRKEQQQQLVRLAFEVGRATENCSCGACNELRRIAPAVFLQLSAEESQ